MLKKFAAAAMSALVLCTTALAQTFDIDISPKSFAGFVKCKNASLVKYKGEYAIKVSADDFAGFSDTLVNIPVDLSKTAGKHVSISFEMVSEDGIESKSGNTLSGGSRTFFKYVKDGQPVYSSSQSMSGKFDAKGGMILSMLPNDVLSGNLLLGLYNAKGTIYFKNIKLIASKNSSYWVPNLPPDFKCKYTSRLSKCPPMRGAMVGTKFKPADLEEFRRWNGNLVRVSMGNAPADNRFGFGDKEEAMINAPDYFEKYDKWLDGKIAQWKLFLDKSQQLGIKVVVGMHSTPGFRYRNKDMRIFFEKKYADKFVESWRKIARELNGHPAIWCYDLCNEPIQSCPTQTEDYLKLQYRAARAVRTVDPHTPISVEAVAWDSPYGFKFLAPLPLDDIIYQVHFYYPGHLTHQGVGGETSKPVAYPDPKRPLGREQLEKTLEHVVRFQKKWGARIYVGEFSCVRWAQGRELYIKDCIDIFESLGWDWTYHAFREWHGWSVEHGSDKADQRRSDTDTPAKKVLLEAFSKNRF